MLDRPKRILLVEDSDDMRALVAEALERDGYVVEQAVDGHAAFARVTKMTSDADLHLVITDVRMPGLSGIQVLETLRAAGRRTPVILMTAFGDGELRAHAFSLDAFLLDKPFSLDELRQYVSRALTR
jgi:DNA-binding response OmpR family regulator